MACSNQHCLIRQECNNDANLMQFKYDTLHMLPCPYCAVQFYCSERCVQQDWFRSHQFKCKAINQKGGLFVEEQEVQRIEQTTPFIKEGVIMDTSKNGQNLSNEGIDFSKLQLSEIQFIKSGNYKLGKGSYGEVQLAEHISSGVKLAIKKIDKQSLANKKIKATLLREVEIHKKLSHENIIRLYTSLEDENYIYLVLEYAAKGNLFYLIRNKKSLTEDEAFYFFTQLCSGMYFLHKNGFIHRDIKPENLLVSDDNTLKICDFGWCVQAKDFQQRNTFCGTLEYMAPEMLANTPHNHTLDIWCIGILLYELVHGTAPFQGVNPKEMQENIMKRRIKYKSTCTKEYKDLVEKLLQNEPNHRLPLIKVFDHAWVKHFEVKYGLSRQISPEKVRQKSPSPKQRQNEPIRAVKSKQNHQSNQSNATSIQSTQNHSTNSKSPINEQQSYSNQKFEKNNLITNVHPSQQLPVKETPDGEMSETWGMSQEFSGSRIYEQSYISDGVNSNRSNRNKNNNSQLKYDGSQFQENGFILDQDSPGEQSPQNDVMKELEELIQKPQKRQNKKKSKKGGPGSHEQEDIYELCNQFLDDLSILDAQIESQDNISRNQIFDNDYDEDNEHHTSLQMINKIEQTIRDSRLRESNKPNLFEGSNRSSVASKGNNGSKSSRVNVIRTSQNDLKKNGYQEQQETPNPSEFDGKQGKTNNRQLQQNVQETPGSQITKKLYDDKPIIMMRETDKQIVDYEKLRQAQMKNFDYLYENLEQQKMDNGDQLKQEVKEYMKVQKNYKKQYKENIEKVQSIGKNARDRSPYIMKDEQDEIKKRQQQPPPDLWNCVRRNNPQQNLQHIPLGEKEAQEYINSRKVDQHLDLDFLPRHLVYNYDGIVESNQMMQKVLEDLENMQQTDDGNGMAGLNFMDESYYSSMQQTNTIQFKNDNEEESLRLEKLRSNIQRKDQHSNGIPSNADEFYQSQRFQSELNYNSNLNQSERSSTYNRNIFNKVRTLEPPLNADDEEWDDEEIFRQQQLFQQYNQKMQKKPIKDTEWDGVEDDDEYYNNQQQQQQNHNKSNRKKSSQKDIRKRSSDDDSEEDEQAYYDRLDSKLSNDYHIQKAAERQKQRRMEEEKRRRLMQGINLDKNQQNKNGLLNSIASMFTFGCAGANNK